MTNAFAAADGQIRPFGTAIRGGALDCHPCYVCIVSNGVITAEPGGGSDRIDILGRPGKECKSRPVAMPGLRA